MKKVSKSAQIRALYEQGMSNKQIAETLEFKQAYVSQITGNYRRLLKAAGKSIETHGKPATIPDKLPPTRDVIYVHKIRLPKGTTVLDRLRQLARWVWTGKVSA